MKYLFWVVFFLFYSISSAQTRDFKGDTQSDMNLNATNQYKKINDKMINLYKKILLKNSKDLLFIKNLKESQIVWLKWRELEIQTFFPNYDDSRTFYGSMQPQCRISKLMDWTQERINQLEIYLNGVEKDDLCGPGRS